jgi:hypothetical protein
MRSVVIMLIFGTAGFCLTYFGLPKKSEVRYNCDIAEISPDFPIEVKQQCRELRAKQ